MTSKLVGNLKRGLPFIISAPAGTGKTTLADMLVQEFPQVVQSISCTTRQPREGEVPGDHYHFLTKSEFEQKIAADEFLEYVQLYGHYYGTSKEKVQEELNQGKHVILTIDTQGALQLKGRYEGIFIFMFPPSLDVLRQRLIQRQTEPIEVIEERLTWAIKEMEVAKQYDYIIVNDNLKITYQALLSIIVAEEHRAFHFSKSF